MNNKIKNKFNLADIIILKKFAYYEDLAHKLAYENLVEIGNTAQLNLLNYNEQKEIASVTRIPIENPSIVAYILAIESEDPGLPNKVQVIWRGTHDLGSAIADLDPISPGYQEYLKNRTTILSTVNDTIKSLKEKNGKPVALGSYGHSLGGSLAQVFAVDIMDAITQNIVNSNHKKQKVKNNKSNEDILKNIKKFVMEIPESSRDAFSNVKNITIGTFNSAGVSTNTVDRANAFDMYLHNKVPKEERPMISYFAGLNHGDGVQQTGESTILANSDTSHVYLLKTNVNNEYYNKMLKNSLYLGSFMLLTTKTLVLGTNLFANLIFSKMFYKTTKSALGTINAHTAKLFDTQFDEQRCLQNKVVNNIELLKNNNLTDKHRIEKSLNKKSKLLQNPIVKFMQKKIYFIFDKMHKTHTKLKKKSKL